MFEAHVLTLKILSNILLVEWIGVDTMSIILETYKAKAVKEGGGVIVNRVFGYGQTKAFDPFLMVDYFQTDSDKLSKGFPWHPHKGIETITYMLRGHMEHQDTLGNRGIIGGGELQWMTAGRGIIHQEYHSKEFTKSGGTFGTWASTLCSLSRLALPQNLSKRLGMSFPSLCRNGPAMGEPTEATQND